MNPPARLGPLSSMRNMMERPAAFGLREPALWLRCARGCAQLREGLADPVGNLIQVR